MVSGHTILEIVRYGIVKKLLIPILCHEGWYCGSETTKVQENNEAIGALEY